MEWNRAESRFSGQTLEQVDSRYKPYISGGLSPAKLRPWSYIMYARFTSNKYGRLDRDIHEE